MEVKKKVVILSEVCASKIRISPQNIFKAFTLVILINYVQSKSLLTPIHLRIFLPPWSYLDFSIGYHESFATIKIENGFKLKS